MRLRGGIDDFLNLVGIQRHAGAILSMLRGALTVAEADLLLALILES
jgi:hypothetical protein